MLEETKPMPRKRVPKVYEKTEAQIQSEILDYLKKRGIFHWRDKQGAYQRYINPLQGDTAGLPDIQGILREGVWKGKFFGVEVKAKGGRLRPKQEAFLNRARECGALVFIATSVECVETMFRENGIRA